MFKYIYYRLYTFYRNIVNKNDVPGITALSLIGLALHNNVSIIYLLFFPDVSICGGNQLKEWVITLGVLFVLTMGLSYAPIAKLESRWKNESKEMRARNGWLVVLYLILSPLLFFICIYCVRNLGMRLV